MLKDDLFEDFRTGLKQIEPIIVHLFKIFIYEFLVTPAFQRKDIEFSSNLQQCEDPIFMEILL